MEELKNTYYVLLNDEGRITLLTVGRQLEEQVPFEFPLDFNPSEIIDYKIVDGELVYDKYEPPVPVLTPEEKREQAYRTEPIIDWQGEMITVDAANDLWLKYSAEGSIIANELSALIVQAKASIRETYPEEV